MEKRRQATYTIKCPIQITVCGDNSLDGDELFAFAIKQIYQRLENGYFDVLEKDVEIADKKTHYTLAELQEQDRQWNLFVGKKVGARNGI